MEFNILRSTEKIECKRKELQEKWKRNNNNHKGKRISWSMPAYPDVLPQLKTAIFNSKHRKEFFNVYYHIKTKEGYLEEFIPAAEYYNFVFQSISDKVYATTLNIARIIDTIDSLKERHASTRIVREKTGQPFFEAFNEVYILKSELAAFLFNVRSVMDVLATMMHFLYGPSYKQFSSFVDYVKFAIKDDQVKKDGVADPVMKNYLQDHLEWFWILRDIRDYITHLSSLKISLFEDDEQALKVYVENQFELLELLGGTYEGLKNFLSFFDEHFSNILAS